MSQIVQSYSQRANQLDILFARRYKYIKYHNLSLRRSIHRDTFRVCKHLENYSRDHVSTWTIPRTSRREMLRREVERLYRSFEQGTFERGGGGFNLRWMHDRAENARGKRRGLGSKIHNGVEENAEGERGGDTFFERTFREIFSNLSLSRFSLTPRPLFLASPPPRITDAITPSVARYAASHCSWEIAVSLAQRYSFLRIPLIVLAEREIRNKTSESSVSTPILLGRALCFRRFPFS